MQSKSWLLPDGIDELLPPQALAMEQLRRDLLDTYALWGYQLVVTPVIEYLDSLLTGSGRDLQHQTFQLTDQLSGRQLGIRADITPQVARIDAHQLREDGPSRLCYSGSVLRTRPDGFSASRSPMQIGAELYGHSGADSDLEVLCLMLETLKVAGLDEVYLDLGHVGIFRGLSAAAGLNGEQEGALFAALQRKAKPEIAELVAGFDVDPEMGLMLNALSDLNGGVAVLAKARELLAAAPREVLAHVDYLQSLGERLSQCEPGVPLHYDLAELRAYNYQTGVVFAAFVPGQGNEVARGGRYDEVGEKFGRARPATGFTCDLKTLMSLGNRQSNIATNGILAPSLDDADLLEKIAHLRAQGRVVVRAMPGLPQSSGVSEQLEKTDKGWVVTPLN